ncbi:MAG: asparagine synthase (glutamine-hydrolyzing) [Nitrospira sp.]|nr:asparagine synthase (glutamine-hydrolyzing) [Nitrospira sp.]
MCGIAGIAYRGEKIKKISGEAVRRMIAIQKHRGPDGEGYYDNVGISLGHCRLAIIDLAETGHQPMSDHSRRYWITYNGEIYNYVELKEELIELGVHFVGHSDTEVLLNAYCQWGQGCVSKLRGMFAFAIWDAREKVLFAARDRLGIKPFHYWSNGEGQLAFSSEIKALLPLLPTRLVNRRLAQAFLAWNLLDHHESETMFDGIRRLPPGHTLTWKSEGSLQVNRYWTLSYTDEIFTTDVQKVPMVKEFRRRFEESVALHLRADVPVGTCLSGGLDSSAIVCVINAVMKKLKGTVPEKFQHTFSAYFHEPNLDEREYMQEVIGATGCTPHYVNPQGEWLSNDLKKWLWHQDEPVGGTGVYVQYCVARLTKEQGIKVLLDGQGADEQLAGYRKFILVYLKQLIREGRYLKAFNETIKFLSSIDLLRTTRFAEGRRYLLGSSSEIKALWPDGEVGRPPVEIGLNDTLGHRLQSDLLQYSLPVLLRYEDRNSMAFGIESRVPFLDHPFVEWLSGLPGDVKIGSGWTKRILRDALKGILPEKVRLRKSKLGFSAPETEWLEGPLSQWLQSALSNPQYLKDVVDADGLQQLIQWRKNGDRSLSLQNLLFRLAIYETWANLFLGAKSGVMQSADAPINFEA